jgi:mannose-6-phosphate isomerase-like protein (cupin superfamily)
MGKYTIGEEEVREIELPGRKVKKIIAPDAFGPCKNMDMGIAEFPARIVAPEHVHENEEEISYIISGEGELYIEGRIEKLKPGISVYIPPGLPHHTRNTGNEILKVLYVLSPPPALHTRRA